LKKKMEERDQQRQAIDASPGGTGRLRAGVATARDGLERGRLHVEDAAWFLREKVAWPARDGFEEFGGRARDGFDDVGGRARDGFDGLGRRGRIGLFGGGAVALGAVVAAIAIGTGGGSGPNAATTEALVIRKTPAPAVSTAPVAKPKKKTSPKPSGPTLHGPAPDFSPAKNVKGGVGPGKAVGKEAVTLDSTASDAPAARGSGAGDTPASTAKIGSTPQASASAQAEAETLSHKSAGVGLAENETNAQGAEGSPTVTGPSAPKAAKQTARRFAEAFVLYEIGGVEGKVRSAFRHTSTKQLSRALLHRPPRQVPQAKVVNVVAGPSHEGVYPVSVSLLRVGVTSELRLQLEQGADHKWQVTNVLG
jgi:hypothetical protein